MRAAAGGGGPAVSPQATSRATSAGAGLGPAILPTDEADGLRQAVGEHREVGGAMGEVLDGPELPRCRCRHRLRLRRRGLGARLRLLERLQDPARELANAACQLRHALACAGSARRRLGDMAQVLYPLGGGDRKSTRLNSSHVKISYAVFCLKK